MTRDTDRKVPGSWSTEDVPSNDLDWHHLAQKMQEEKDPSKVIELAQQLIAKLDEGRFEGSLPSKSKRSVSPLEQPRPCASRKSYPDE